MNVIAGQLSQDGTCHFRATQLDLEFPNHTVPAAAIGPRISLGVRAEHVHIGDSGVPAEVRLTEPLGDETLVFFDYGGETELVAKMGGDCELKVGDRIRFRFNAGGVLFFDTPDGTRIA
jgi:multiple sugar transport system ATP-binding protein